MLVHVIKPLKESMSTQHNPALKNGIKTQLLIFIFGPHFLGSVIRLAGTRGADSISQDYIILCVLPAGKREGKNFSFPEAPAKYPFLSHWLYMGYFLELSWWLQCHTLNHLGTCPCSTPSSGDGVNSTLTWLRVGKRTISQRKIRIPFKKKNTQGKMEIKWPKFKN